MAEQLFLNFKQFIISKHNDHLDQLEMLYSQRITDLLIQKRLISKQMNKDFVRNMKVINELIYLSDSKTKSDHNEHRQSIQYLGATQINDFENDSSVETVQSAESQPRQFKIIQYDPLNSNKEETKIKQSSIRKFKSGEDCHRSKSVKVKTNASKKNVKVHHKMYFSPKPFKCTTCHKSFTSKGALSVHKRLHSGSSAYPFACKVCSKRFNQIPNLRHHLLSHTKELPWKCKATSCGEAFKTKSLLETHIKKSLHQHWNETIVKEEPTMANNLLNESLIQERGYGLRGRRSSCTPKSIKDTQ